MGVLGDHFVVLSCLVFSLGFGLGKVRAGLDPTLDHVQNVNLGEIGLVGRTLTEKLFRVCGLGQSRILGKY